MFDTSPSPVSAVIVTQEVMSVPAFVMKIFEPSTTHSPSRSSARVCVAPASDPAPGSVRPKAASFRPDARSGSHCLLLLLRAEEEDRHRAERRVRGDRDAHGGVDPRQLLDRDRVGDRVAAGAAPFLRDGKAHEAEPGELLDELVGKAVLAVELLGDGRDPLLCELADGAPDELVLFCELEVHRDVRRSASDAIRRTPQPVPPTCER